MLTKSHEIVKRRYFLSQFQLLGRQMQPILIYYRGLRYRALIGLNGFILSAALLGGCRFSPLEQLNRLFEQITSQERPQASQNPLQKSNPILARVGDGNITWTDYQHALTLLPNPPQDPGTPQIRLEVLNAMIDQKLIEISAHKLGAQNDIDFQRQRAAFEKNLLRNWLAAHLPAVSDTDLSQYYRAHKQDYQPRVEITASRIVCLSVDGAKKAQALLARGQSFAEVSQEMLRTKEAYTAGPIGILVKGNMVSRLEKALSALRTGQVSGIIPANPGYELLRKDSEIQRPGIGFEQAKPKIKNILEAQKFDLYLKKQRASTKISLYPNALNPNDQPQSAAPNRSKLINLSANPDASQSAPKK
jgi:peptidyl-prolyl cis-trans isomerase C